MMKKTEKNSSHKKKKLKTNRGGMNLYSNMVYRRESKKDAESRKRAEELAKLPKNPFLRVLARLRPDRFFKWFFSARGQKAIWKGIATLVLLGLIGVGGLFLYFKKDLSEIDPEEIANRVANTVNVYLDRNGEVLWEDKGSGDYRLVVDKDEISQWARYATVSIEDRSFYEHIGVDPKGLLRAVIMTLSGKSVQGGSTLTQQLIKQVYFSEEAKDRTLSGLPRKIKEVILAIEIEKMYSKEDIITMYLNESPYGGRRNGIESAARTYFGKSAKDLDIAESALLAAIPNNPAIPNPYNTAGNEALIARQHKVLNSMLELNYIKQEEYDEAMEVDILARVLPESNQYADMRAPWFVLEVKSQLENKYGLSVMREGGFTITTTVDAEAQRIAEEAVAEGAKYMYVNGSDNATLVSVDTETSQVIAMVGSVDWNRGGYGQVNAATSLLEPASSIKPILDYAPLFEERDGQNYGPGTILADENIDAVYCRGTYGKCRLRNASGKFYGNITIRRSLASSYNIGAVKALYINGINNSLETAHGLGDISYCANGENAGLSMAIGGGCAVRPVEHANAYASLARGGVYKDLVYVLEVKNSSGDVIESWSDTEGTRVISDEAAYMVTDILADVNTRKINFGGLATTPGFYSNKVWFAAKTGTTENGAGSAKDSWIMSYSSAIATAVWNGNHDGSVLSSDSHTVALKINAAYIDRVHQEVLAKSGRWHNGDKIAEPSGMKHMTVNGVTDIWPSWYNNKTTPNTSEKLAFDSVSKKLATDCTPDETRIEVNVSKIIDPVTDKVTYFANGYNPEEEDDIHTCGDKKPTASLTVTPSGAISTPPAEDDGDDDGDNKPSTATNYLITGNASFGRYSLSSYELIVDGETVKSGELSASSDTITYMSSSKPKNVKFIVIDAGGYKTTVTK